MASPSLSPSSPLPDSPLIPRPRAEKHSPSSPSPDSPLISQPRAEKHEGYIVLRDITYVAGSELPNHKLDLYLPDSCEDAAAGEKIPLCVQVHGGGWSRGHRASKWRGSPIVGRHLAREGTAVAAISYRLITPSWRATFARAFLRSLLFTCLLSYPLVRLGFGACAGLAGFAKVLAASFIPSILVQSFFKIREHLRSPEPVTFRQQVADIVAVLQWIGEGNVERICPAVDVSEGVFCAGHSAGAHLLSLAVLHPHLTKLLSRTQSGRNLLAAKSLALPPVLGVVTISGVFTIVSPLAERMYHWRNIIFRAFYANVAFSAADWDEASPTTHAAEIAAQRKRVVELGNDDEKGAEVGGKEVVPRGRASVACDKGGTPPFVVLSAARDMGLEVDAARFVKLLREAGVRVDHHEVPNTSHSTIASRLDRHDAGQHVLNFIERRLNDLSHWDVKLRRSKAMQR